MQIFLNASEIDTIHEALITEKREAMRDLENAKRKGRGDFELKYLHKVDALLSRISPYVEG